jgi:exopolysaccharide biosynthesis polyprenyl glycosylphosphotransferase
MNTAELNRAPEDVAGLVVTPGAGRTTFRLSLRERRALLAGADFIVAAVAMLIAYELHPGHLVAIPLLEPLLYGATFVIALLLTDGYGFNIPSDRTWSAIAVIRAAPIALLGSVLIFFLHPFVLNRTIIVLALLIGSAMLILMRITVARLLLHESLAVHAVLLADSEPRQEIIATLHAARFEYRVMKTMVEPANDTEERRDMLAKVSSTLKDSRADELIVTNSELRLLPGLAEECLVQGVRVVSASELVERYMGRVPIETIDVHWFLSLPDNDLLERPYAFARRIADLFLSLIFSLPFLVLLPILALLIKVDSKGPVFLVQRRIGEHGKPFNLLKLRTMRIDAESGGARMTEKGDPRITRVGRVLRTTRLDEFPQLVNIFVGEMSFIGPRPERPEIIKDLERQIPHFRSRLLVKPGLTGWAQTRSGYASTVDEMERKLEYDLYYIKNRSLRLDLQILAATFITVLGWKGR